MRVRYDDCGISASDEVDHFVFSGVITSVIRGNADTQRNTVVTIQTYSPLRNTVVGGYKIGQGVISKTSDELNAIQCTVRKPSAMSVSAGLTIESDKMRCSSATPEDVNLCLADATRSELKLYFEF